MSIIHSNLFFTTEGTPIVFMCTKGSDCLDFCFNNEGWIFQQIYTLWRLATSKTLKNERNNLMSFTHLKTSRNAGSNILFWQKNFLGHYLVKHLQEFWFQNSWDLSWVLEWKLMRRQHSFRQTKIIIILISYINISFVLLLKFLVVWPFSFRLQ